jgi:hypothetical protein
MTWDQIYTFACVAVVMNILVSIDIIKRRGLERFQIVGQIVLVWVIPFLAAIGIVLLYRSQERPTHSAGSVTHDTNFGNYAGGGEL